MSETIPPEEWKALYTAAMLECDDTQLWGRIETAEAAMRTRLKQLSELPSLGSEQKELQDALDYLRLLKNISPHGFSDGSANVCS
jgi:hypothetical protein